MPRPNQTKKTIIGDQRWKKKKREGTWNVIWYHTMALRLGELPRLTAVWRVLQRCVLFLWQHAPNRKSAFPYGVSGLKWFLLSWQNLNWQKTSISKYEIFLAFDCFSFRYNFHLDTIWQCWQKLGDKKCQREFKWEKSFQMQMDSFCQLNGFWFQSKMFWPF